MRATQKQRPGIGARLRSLNGVERFGLISVACLLVLAVIGPAIAPYPTMDADPTIRLLPPGGAHWLGTDENGMDVLSRILAAPRVDVSVAFLAISLAVSIGIPLGVLAGFFEGSGRRVASLLGELTLRVLDVIQAFPVFILAMVLVAIRGASTENIVAAIAFVNMPTFLRLARAEVLTLRDRPFAEAARSIGASDTRIAFRHLLPNALPVLIAQVSVTLGFAILLTAGLSFVGAGVAAPTPELGGMISTGSRMMITGQWWPALFPGVALGLIVFAFATAGQGLAHLVEPVSVHSGGQVAEDPTLNDAVAAAHATVAPYIAVPSGTGSPSAPSQPVSGSEQGSDPPAQCLLAVEGLSVEFGDPRSGTRVLNNVSLSVYSGEAFGIIGESGSGKSVLARTLLRLLPEEGRIVGGSVRYRDLDLLALEGEELRKLRMIEFAPILPSAKLQLSPVSTVADLMVLAYQSHVKADRKEALSAAIEALRLVGIQDAERRLNSYPHELSGGMAQRVCIAMALLHRPRLVIADEPTSGLDVTVQRQVLDQMAMAAHERQAAQLIVTRDLGIVAQYCQRMAVMHGGRIVEQGPTQDVLGRPQHRYTSRLLEAVDPRLMRASR